MKQLLLILLSLMVFGDALANDEEVVFEQAVRRLQFCDGVYTALREFEDYKSTPRWYWFESSKERHGYYKRHIEIQKKSKFYIEIETRVGAVQAEAFRQRCESSPRRWTEIIADLEPTFSDYGLVKKRLLDKDGKTPAAHIEQARKGIILAELTRSAEQRRLSQIMERFSTIESIYIESNYSVTLVPVNTDTGEIYQEYNHEMFQQLSVGRAAYEKLQPGHRVIGSFSISVPSGDSTVTRNLYIRLHSKWTQTQKMIKFKNEASPQVLSDFQFQRLSDMMKTEYGSSTYSYDLFGRQVTVLLDREMSAFHIQAVTPVLSDYLILRLDSERFLNSSFYKILEKGNIPLMFEVDIPSSKTTPLNKELDLRNPFLSGNLHGLQGYGRFARTEPHRQLFFAKTQEGPTLILNREQLRQFGMVQK